MLRNFTFGLTLAFLSLNLYGQTNVVNLLIYTDFLNPKNTYDAMVSDFKSFGITDSIRIIGQPILEPVIEMEFDTAKIRRLGIKLNDINNLITKSVKNQTDLETLLQEHITCANGKKVPISSFIYLYQSTDHYKPSIYLPYPEKFEHEGKQAVKVEFYCNEKNTKFLIYLIARHIDKYKDKDLLTAYSKVDYEIVRW